MLLVSRIVTELRRAWSDSKVLTAGSLLMLVAFVASVIGIVFDDTIVTGVPAWLKPAKFSISTSIFLGTMAWIYRYITVWPGFMRALGWVLSGVLVVEVAIISIQAVRGTPSHFNVATSVDGALFGIMGVAIAMLWLAMVGVSVALFRQNFPDPAWGWSLRLAVLVTVLGSAAGGMMLRLTPEQSEAFRRGEPLTAAGAHTVGAPMAETEFRVSGGAPITVTCGFLISSDCMVFRSSPYWVGLPHAGVGRGMIERISVWRLWQRRAMWASSAS